MPASTLPIRPSCRLPVTVLIALFALALLPPAGPVAAAPEVVGDGTPASCTSAALAAALAGGGEISFNCGSAPHSITVSAAYEITAPATTVDGGGLITLQGQGSQIFIHRTTGTASSTLTLRNLTVAGGRSSGANEAANGGAIESFFQAANSAAIPILIVENVIFRDNDATVTSVTSGEAYDYGGGAIYSRGGRVSISGSQFLDNDASNGAGGAIHILQSGLVISDTLFSNNTALGASPANSLGGAIYIDGLGGENSLFRVSGGRFVNNRAYNSGGAIYVNMYENSSRTEISTSSFEGNAVVGGTRAQGGAIGGGGTSSGGATGNPSIVISESLFVGNSVRRTAGAAGNSSEDGSGGALAFPQRTRLRIVNSTFESNRAYGSSFNANGGALYVVNHTSQFEIVNSTFANNYAGWVGGAISNSTLPDPEDPQQPIPGGRVENTIFYNNTADNGPNDWNIQQHCSSELDHDGRSLQFPPRLTGANFFNDVTCFAGKSAPGQTSDPQFRDALVQPLADNGGPTRTMAIGLDSPALDAGAACPAIDQRGVPRPQLAACDLGAFELQVGLSVVPALLAVGTENRQITVSGVGFDTSSVVQVNGTDRPTILDDARTLRAELSPADVAAPGVLTVSVRGAGSALAPATVRVVDEVFRTTLPFLRR
ncbi:MAG: choice-of-anchor Q domain-containing protein [Chloroflexi bacterium OHK40]